MQADTPRILTNMAFWESPLWQTRVASIHTPDTADPDGVPALRVAWQLFRQRHRYDVILTMGVRPAMTYALLCALTRRPAKQVMCEVFLDEARPTDLVWKLKTALYRKLAARSLGIITNSSKEIETMAARYHLPTAHFHFVPLCSTLPPQPDAPEDDPPFILSAGRTRRDFDLVVAAARAINTPVHIVCGRHDLRHADLPQNLTLHREIERPAYLDLLRRCALVALPLKPTERATGQVVMLEAMAMGKPVITTRAPGTLDTIRHRENGWLIDGGDAAGLIRACTHLIDTPAERHTLGQQAREEIAAHYSYAIFAENTLAAIERCHAQNNQ